MPLGHPIFDSDQLCLILLGDLNIIVSYQIRHLSVEFLFSFHYKQWKFCDICSLTLTITNKTEYVQLNCSSHCQPIEFGKQSDEVIKPKVQVINYINEKPKKCLGFLN
jgi:hypothetical protein